MDTCVEYLSDRGDAEQIKRIVEHNCMPQFSDYSEERCPTEQAIGRCLHKRRTRYESLDPNSESSLAELFYAPTTEENARLRCGEGMFQAAPL